MSDAVTIEEAVTVAWVRGAHRPRVRVAQGPSSSSAESVLVALCSCFWPQDLTPASTRVRDEVLRQLTEHLQEAGIEPGFLNTIRAAIAPGASALLVVSLDVDLDAIRDVIERGRARGDVTLLHTWLAPDTATHFIRARDSLRRQRGDSAGPVLLPRPTPAPEC